MEESENITENKDREPGHYCPYCDHKEMQINQHFAHIEFFHPDEPLVILNN